jgi:hypothetical protein
MRHPGPVTQAAISLATWALIIIFSPVVLVAGEPVNRYIMRRVRWSAPTVTMVTVVHYGDRSARAVAPARLPLHVCLLFIAMSNPLWIVLTAPGRWVSDRFRRPPSRVGGTVSGH